jgi:hypothetical protein
MSNSQLPIFNFQVAGCFRSWRFCFWQNHRFRLDRKAVPPVTYRPIFKERWREFFITPGDNPTSLFSYEGLKKTALRILHEPARMVRKIAIFEEVKIAKSLWVKE